MFKSIRTKILVPVIILLVVIFILVRLISLNATRNNAEKIVVQRDTEIARISSERLSESLNQSIKILREAARDEIIVSSMETLSNTYFDKYKQELHLYDVGVLIFNETGNLALTNPVEYRSHANQAKYYPEFEKVRDSIRPVFSNLHQDQISGKQVIFIGTPIINKNGEFSGVLGGLVSLKYSILSARILEVLEFKAGRDFYAYIVDGNGKIISHRYDHVIGKNISNSEAVAQVLKKRTGAVISEDHEQIKVISGYAPVPGTDWGIITRERWDNISGPIKKYSNTLSGILALEIIIIFLIILLSLERIVGPVKDITEGAKTIAAGNFDSTINIRSKDELQTLAEQFNIMANELKKIYDELEDRVRLKTAELQNANILLQKQKKELDRFVYVASHDLKAPLRGIAASSKVLEEDYQEHLDEQGLKFLDHISNGVHRMENLINDLLKLTRITRIRNPYEQTDINRTLENILSRVEYDIKKHNIKIKYPESIPEIYCDPIKISELFSNLIDNAIKFSTRENKNQPVIEIEYGYDDEFHRFSVKDNGIGIDPKFFKKIFQTFSRLHYEGEYSGTGIGLNIVQCIVEEHNGKIIVESEPGKGTKFIFTISKRLKEKTGKERENDSTTPI